MSNTIINNEADKSKPLSKEETKALLDLVEGSKIINNKATNATNNKLKTEEWARITDLFNATATTCRRRPQQLRLKWENLKKLSRKRSTRIRMNSIQTGGGAPDYIPPDDILDRVASLLGSTSTGFTVPFGGDREPEALIFVNDNGEGAEDVVNVGVPATVNEFVVEEGPDIQSVQNNVVITECEVLDTNKQKRFRLDTLRNGKKKREAFDGIDRIARNRALAEYYISKKKCVDAKLENILLQNEKLKLENKKLKLELEKLQ